MKTQLLCTFTNTKGLSKTVDKIIEAYDILYNKLFVLRNESYQLDWENYRNSILLTNDSGLRRIDTSVHEVIYIKVKK
jgi:predicted transposase YbfD/YdcC